MRMSATWDEFKLKLDEWYPRFDDTMQLPFSSGVYALPLNDRKIATPAGDVWHAATVIRVQKRLGLV
jgi:hypothetical protein